MKKLFTLSLFICLLSIFPDIQILAQSLRTGENFNGICGRPRFESYDYKQVEENTKLYNPELYFNAIKNTGQDKIQTDTVGTIRKFYALNDTSGTNVFYEINAKLMVKGNLVQIWADTSELANNHVTMANVNSLLNALENQTPAGSKNPAKGIIKLLTENFGSPPNKDGDNLTDFLLLDIIDKKKSNAVTLGYFYSYDQTDGTYSNKRDILYIDTNPTTINNALSTLAHEFQHLIHYNYDKTETTFLNEGLSLYSEVFCGYSMRSPSRYFQNTNRALFSWDRDDSLPDYSRAGLFTQYYMERLGDSHIKAVVEDQSHADTSLSKIFQVWKGYKFQKLFSNWAIANYAKSQAYDSSYGYVRNINGRPKLKSTFDEPNTTRGSLPLKNYSIEYHKIESLEGSVKIDLQGTDIHGKIIGYPKGSSVYYDSINTGNTYIIPSFSLDIDSVICPIINLGNTENTYDLTVESNDDETYWAWSEWITTLLFLTFDGNDRIYGTAYPGGQLHYSKFPDYKFNPIYSDSFAVNTRPAFISPSEIIIGTASDGVWMSSDTGNTWTSIGLEQEVANSPITGVAVNSNGDIFASVYRLNYLFYRSTDGGTTWENIDNDILNTIYKRGYNIVVDGLNNVYAFTDYNEIYFSEDNGDSWDLIDDSWDHFSNVARLDNEGSLVAYSANNGLFKRDFFTQLIEPLGLPKYWNYNDVAFNPEDDDIVYASVSGPQERKGVYRSEDGGVSWRIINSGLEELPVISLAVNKRGMAIAASNSAVHIVDTSQVTDVKRINENKPKEYVLHNNYPNPFNPSTTIEFSLVAPGKVSLLIYNILGQKLEELVNEFKPAGNYKVHFNAERLSTGVYFYQLQTNNFVDTKKMILIK